MAEHPFWDDDCLRGSIDRTPLPPPPRSLFEHDLFCYENDLDNIPSLEDGLPPLPQSPILNSPPPNSLCASLPSPKPMLELLPSPPSPARQWRSFLDDNCPLRKRVKVTITQPTRKRQLPMKHVPSQVTASPSKKRRLSPIRTGPRRLQTTLRLPCPGDPTPRLALHIPKEGKPSSRGVMSDGVLSSGVLPSGVLPSGVLPSGVLPSRVLSSGVLSSKPDVAQQPRRTSRPALQRRACITSDLSERLKSMKTRRRSVSSPLGARLPLVDVAVQAVSRAAQAYRKALSTVAAFPSSGHSAGKAGKAQQVSKIGKARGGRRRKGKKGRTLLSFDDKEVAPLVKEEANVGKSALFYYLNSPSSRQTAVH